MRYSTRSALHKQQLLTRKEITSSIFLEHAQVSCVDDVTHLQLNARLCYKLYSDVRTVITDPLSHRVVCFTCIVRINTALIVIKNLLYTAPNKV